MASNLLKLPLTQITKTQPSSHPSTLLPKGALFPSLPLHQHHNQHQHQLQSHLPLFSLKHFQCSKFSYSPIQASLSSYSPPTSKEEAILQAKTCLSTTLEKTLNNPRLSGKLKKQKQPKFRVEIPVIDDSPESLTHLAFDFFHDLPIRTKGAKLNVTVLWPNRILANLANKAFSNSTSSKLAIENVDISSLSNSSTRILNSADVAVFLAPEASQLEVMKMVSDNLFPKPMVVLNTKWAFEEENDFGDLDSFVKSFEVVYSFLGLEVRGVFSKKNGVVFKSAKDGILNEKWAVWVEEEGGELKVITKFTKRPSIGEVENVLYNLMAVNSPITKSAKFFRDLVSNVTGKK